MGKRYDSKKRLLRTGEYVRNDGYYAYREIVAGKRKVIYAKTLGELRKKEQELHDKISKGLDIDKQGIRLNELAEGFFARKVKTLQPSSYYTMTNMYNLYVRNSIGNMAVSDIRRSVIKDLYLELITGNDKKKGISIGTLSRLNTVIRPLFESAVYDDIILKNPVSGVLTEIKNECGGKPKRLPALTENEQEEFLNFLFTTSKHECIRNMIVVLLGTGCRVSEVIGLRWDDVDFKNNSISINHAVGYIKKEGHYAQYIKKPKTTAGERMIPMLSEVRNALLKEKDIRNKHKIVQPIIDEYTNFIFLTKKGTIYTREGVWQHIRQLIDEYNEMYGEEVLKHFTTHQLRHTFATRLCRNSSDLKSIQSILGHADISTTLNIYADATEDGIKESMGALEGVMFRRRRT